MKPFIFKIFNQPDDTHFQDMNLHRKAIRVHQEMMLWLSLIILAFGVKLCNGESFSITDEGGPSLITSRTIYINGFVRGIDNPVSIPLINNKNLDELALQDITHYRLSLPWQRLIGNISDSDRIETFNEYKDMFKTLNRSGIEPLVTLFDANLDSKFAKRMWSDQQSITLFHSYIETCFHHLKSYVKMWITIASPQLINHDESSLSLRNVLLAHGRAAKLIREYSPSDVRIGLGIDGNWNEAVSSLPDHVNTASHSLERQFLWYLDPLYKGGYSRSIKVSHGGSIALFTNEEQEILRGSNDFLLLTHHHLGRDFEKALSWLDAEYDSPEIYIKESPEWNKGDATHIQNVRNAILHENVNIRGFFSFTKERLSQKFQATSAV